MANSVTKPASGSKALKIGGAILGVLVACVGWYLGARSMQADVEGEAAGNTHQIQSLPLPTTSNKSVATGDTTTLGRQIKDVQIQQSAKGEDNLTPEMRAERLIQKIKVLAEEYNILQQQLFLNQPELPGLRKYVMNRPGEINEDINHLIDEVTLYLQDKQFGKAWTDLHALRRPWDLLAVLDDPVFASYFRDVWENAGINQVVSDWIRNTDRLAGVKSLPGGQVLSFAELRVILESRLASYQRAADSISQQANVPGRLKQALESTPEYFKVQVAEWYVESFYSGRLEQIRREQNKLTNDLGQLYNRNKSEAMEALMKQTLSINFPDLGKK